MCFNVTFPAISAIKKTSYKTTDKQILLYLGRALRISVCRRPVWENAPLGACVSPNWMFYPGSQSSGWVRVCPPWCLWFSRWTLYRKPLCSHPSKFTSFLLQVFWKVLWYCTCPSMGPKGGPAAAIPAGMFVRNLPCATLSTTAFFTDFSLAAALDIF